MRKIFHIEKGKSSGGGGGRGEGGSWAEKIYDKKCFAAASGLFSSFFRKLTLLNKRFRLCEVSTKYLNFFLEDRQT